MGKSKKRNFIAEFLIATTVLVALAATVYAYKNGDSVIAVARYSLSRFYPDIFDDANEHSAIVRKLVRTDTDETLFGIDVSHYQGKIHWNKLNGINKSTPISFIILRASMGCNGADKHFDEYWTQAKWKGITRGAYHYFRPNESGKEQALKFMSVVKLGRGDLPPVVDIEKEPRKRRIDNLRRELKIFLDMVEEHYGVKPIIYTMDSFFQSYLSNGAFDDYPLWIANYNLESLPKSGHWVIWQFSDKGKIDGVDHYVDLNIFRGNRSKFEKLVIK